MLEADIIYSWVISDGKMVYGYDDKGDDVLFRAFRWLNVPDGTVVFHSEEDALNAIRDLRVIGSFPSFIKGAKPTKVYPSKMRWNP